VASNNAEIKLTDLEKVQMLIDSGLNHTEQTEAGEGVDYKAVLNEQIETLRDLSKENLKSTLAINAKMETAVTLAEQIRKLCFDANM